MDLNHRNYHMLSKTWWLVVLIGLSATLGIVTLNDLTNAQTETGAASETEHVLQSGDQNPQANKSNSTTKQQHEKSLVELIAEGGYFMIPILICSIIAAAVIVERLLAFNAAKEDTELLVTEVENAIKGGALRTAERMCSESTGPVAQVLATGLSKTGNGRVEIQEAMLFAINVQRAKLERFLGTLVTISNVAPLFGFLGTVWGLYVAFQSVASAGQLDPAGVAGGVGQALITTVAGLSVAIPANIAYNYFTGRIEWFTLEMDHSVNILSEVLTERNVTAKT